jgi:hypothetical protein
MKMSWVKNLKTALNVGYQATIGAGFLYMIYVIRGQYKLQTEEKKKRDEERLEYCRPVPTTMINPIHLPPLQNDPFFTPKYDNATLKFGLQFNMIMEETKLPSDMVRMMYSYIEPLLFVVYEESYNKITRNTTIKLGFFDSLKEMRDEIRQNCYIYGSARGMNNLTPHKVRFYYGVISPGHIFLDTLRTFKEEVDSVHDSRIARIISKIEREDTKSLSDMKDIPQWNLFVYRNGFSQDGEIRGFYLSQEPLNMTGNGTITAQSQPITLNTLIDL